MAEDDDAEFEETVEDHQIKDEAATGRRWKFCLVMVALGAAAFAAGLHYDKNAAIYGGVTIVIVFGAFAAGSSGVSITFPGGSQASARMPRPFKKKTTVIRKGGFPAKADESAPDEETKKR